MNQTHLATIVGVIPHAVVIPFPAGSIQTNALFALYHTLNFAIGSGADVGGRAGHSNSLSYAIGIGHAFAFCLCHVCAQTQQQGQGQCGFESFHLDTFSDEWNDFIIARNSVLILLIEYPML